VKLPDKIKNQIIEALKPLDPEKVILFGSYAYGEPTADSDIDLYIVTKDDFIPKSFKEKMNIKLKFIDAIDQIRENFPVDLIIHTKKMYKKFVELNSMFSREILNDGMKLYES
jgi:uncharacterized protein